MTTPTPDAHSVAKALERAFSEYQSATSEYGREFFLLKVQILIFYYDVELGLSSLSRVHSLGFARCVALKSLIHSVYEYDKQINGTLIPRIIKLCATRNRPIDMLALKSEKLKWRQQLGTLKRWKNIRNSATGHYGKDMDEQIRLLQTLGQGEVTAAAVAFVHFSVAVLKLLPHSTRSDA